MENESKESQEPIPIQKPDDHILEIHNSRIDVNDLFKHIDKGLENVINPQQEDKPNG